MYESLNFAKPIAKPTDRVMDYFPMNENTNGQLFKSMMF